LPVRMQTRSGLMVVVYVNGVMGPFEEEEEGTGIGRDVVKVEGVTLLCI